MRSPVGSPYERCRIAYVADRAHPYHGFLQRTSARSYTLRGKCCFCTCGRLRWLSGHLATGSSVLRWFLVVCSDMLTRKYGAHTITPRRVILSCQQRAIASALRAACHAGQHSECNQGRQSVWRRMGSSRSWGSSPRERHVQLIRVITRNLLGFRPALVFFRLSYCLFDHIGLIDVRANRFLGDILHRACAPSKYFGRYAFWWIGFHLSDYSKHLPMGSIGG